MHILVVDDDPLLVMNIADLLEDNGHTVSVAASGKDALRLLDELADIDAVITDHAMPRMSGTELAIVARQTRPTLPFLLATGYGDLPNGETSDLPRLSKPYTQKQLVEALQKLVPPAP